MPFTEAVMAAGSWSLTLDPGTPRAIRDAIDVRTAGFSTLLVTSVHLNPDGLTDASMLSLARYGGIYRAQSASGLQLGGAGMNVLLGDEDGKGNVIRTAITTVNGTLAQWFAAGVPTSRVTAGTLTYSGGGALKRKFVHVTHREMWNGICDAFDVEYRVKPSRVFDVGTRDALYGATPGAIILGGSAGASPGRDIGMVGVSGAIGRDIDLEDLTTQVLYLWGDPDAPTAGTYGGNHASLTAASGHALFMERLIDITGGDHDATSAEYEAAGVLYRNSAPRMEWDVAVTGGYDVGRVAPVGSPLWLYDPANGLYDTGNALVFRGTQLAPIQSRLMGMETPIRKGMGVYLRRATSTTTQVWTDLTPYIVPEGGDQRLTIGALPRKSRNQ